MPQTHTSREILRLAIPNILSNLSVPLLGIVDTALMGRQDTPAYLGAVALGTMLFNIIYWGMGFLRMGTTGLTAQALGRQDGEGQALLLARALVVAVGAGILFVVLQVPIVGLGFHLISGETDVIQLAQTYFYVRIWAAPATVSLFAINGWLLGMQDARSPLIITVLGNAINIVLNFYFVNTLGMNVEGVALATVCAQYGSLLVAIGLLVKPLKPLRRYLSWQKVWDAAGLKRFFAVNGDIFIRTMCLIFAFTFFTAQSSALDPLVLAANQILLQYLHTMAFGVDGFAFAAESLVGRYTGAGDKTALKRMIRQLMAWGIGLGLLFSLTYLLGGEMLLRVFTDQVDVLNVAQEYIGWVILLPLTGAYAYMWDGVYFGATATRAMRNAMLITTGGLFLPLALASTVWGNHVLWLAMTLYMLSRGVALHILARRYVY